MRAPALPIVALCLAAACGAPGAPAPGGLPYLDDASFRRTELEASLVNLANGYSRLRLAHYESRDASDWALLPEWNPPVDPIAATELDALGGAPLDTLSPGAMALALPEALTSESDPALVALGRTAFRRFPVQPAPYWSVALASRDAAARFGLWLDDARGAGGLVRARIADGSGAVMVTCSTCHAGPSADGTIVDGLPNARLDVGVAMLAAEGVVDPANPMAAWGPGRLDVTTTTGTEPVRIPDLRPVRWLTYLQQDATVRKSDLTTLAIRIETLIITSHGQVVRPPRVVALALAAYIASLADGLPSPDAATAASPEGASIFAARCAACHQPPGLTGPPVAIGTVGTDPVDGESADRGTGNYRVPSLHGVGTRGPLLHDGTIPSLAAMFDPARITPAFTTKLHGPGAVPGHVYGLDLDDASRTVLIGYLATL